MREFVQVVGKIKSCLEQQMKSGKMQRRGCGCCLPRKKVLNCKVGLNCHVNCTLWNIAMATVCADVFIMSSGHSTSLRFYFLRLFVVEFISL